MCEQCSTSLPVPTGSRRRRLWDLPHQCHCPVIGVCVPLATLRHLVNKALGGKAVADDYEVHVGAVAECTTRNRLSEILQKELEVRHSRSVQAFRATKNTRALADQWAEAVRSGGDVPGAFWATLTHPRCDEVLQEVVLRDMHMLQHQAGAAIRIDVNKVNELIKENGVLSRELGKVQQRCTRVIAEKVAEIEQLEVQLVEQRALLIGRDTRISWLVQEMEQLKATLPDYENASRLRSKVEQLTTRQVELEAQNAQLRKELGLVQRELSSRDKKDVPLPTGEIPPDSVKEVPVSFQLREKTVLCVGGRNGNVANYRTVIEKAGGHFAHHDGGLEDSQGVLDSVLAAADLVICQTGCISHNAYWRVKDFCKRTGKKCVFVENPSTSSLARSLQQIAVDDTAAKTAENSTAP